MQQYYDILEVSPNATEKEVKRQFRKLSMIHHPDRGGNKTKFNEILQAYQYISKLHSNLEKTTLNKNANEDFFKAMFGSKYGPYSRKT
jgi:curved DNA-binding protein CbpA